MLACLWMWMRVPLLSAELFFAGGYGLYFLSQQFTPPFPLFPTLSSSLCLALLLASLPLNSISLNMVLNTKFVSLKMINMYRSIKKNKGQNYVCFFNISGLLNKIMDLYCTALLSKLICSYHGDWACLAKLQFYLAPWQEKECSRWARYQSRQCRLSDPLNNHSKTQIKHPDNVPYCKSYATLKIPVLKLQNTVKHCCCHTTLTMFSKVKCIYFLPFAL